MTDKKSNLTPLAPVIELADEGTDTVYGRVSATLADNVENLVLVGSGNSSGTGNGLDNTLTSKDAGNRNDSEPRGERRLKSRRWRDGSSCANDAWRWTA